MPFLLDTNVVSAARRPDKQDVQFQRFLHTFDMKDAYLSAASIMEIRFGIRREESRNPAFAVDLTRWLNDIVLKEFTDRIIPFDMAIALRAAALPTPNKHPTLDAMIAATALERRLQIVTRNVADFEPFGTQCRNPWQQT